MHAALVYVCIVGALLVVGGGGSEATQQQNKPPDLNGTVAKVIDAMVEDGGRNGTVGVPLVEHHADRGQRIVARKGVINDVATVIRGSVTDQQTPGSEDGASVPAVVASATNNVTHSVPATQSNVTTTTTSVASSASNGGSTIPTISANASSTTASSAKPQPTPTQSKPPSSSTNATTTLGTSGTSSSNSSVSSTSTTTSTTPSTTTTSSTSTSTTTTKPPKKPKITYSVEDEPKLLQAAKPGYGAPYDPVDSSGRLRVDEPLAQFSKEFLGGVGGPGEPPNSRREYIVPIVTLIFAIPLLLGLFLLSYRRAKEFWLTRHYRRMDFLIDGMYNY
ncbi:integumentary mucin C.1 [Anopheles stephensi]|uniref:integumentary mucin C.1 n=1 Tax=Anopheles stephensi TaxID=30069 RepID=UPI0016589813|nr:integumentary mucin C.1 [Anopheles stephensi]